MDIRDALHYDPATGIFTWKIRPSQRTFAGEIAGNMNPDGYRRIKYKKKLYKASRLAFFFMAGRWPTFIDHINQDKGDDRWENLRECEFAENVRNKPKYSNNTSGYTGVHAHRGGWQGRCRLNRRQYYTPTFSTKEECVEAVSQLRKRLHGEFSV